MHSHGHDEVGSLRLLSFGCAVGVWVLASVGSLKGQTASPPTPATATVNPSMGITGGLDAKWP
jgi:hypothetical protein